ncbi:MAG TPA: winged helix-turn-helix domain-containing protein [Gammaproteobacteria bacterium]|nr:winged helix-turn-helix domain-containing protein [Gammaproteobacteria bacterium]
MKSTSSSRTIRPAGSPRRLAEARNVVIQLESEAREPLFLQIARAIAADIRRGRLAAGSRLPGSRTLARTLGVHRNTVLAAYAELTAEGWLGAGSTRGTFVSTALPLALPVPAPVPLRSTDAQERPLGFKLPRRAHVRREPPDAAGALN